MVGPFLLLLYMQYNDSLLTYFPLSCISQGTVFAYGQTSSGKTFTMMCMEDQPGVIPLAIQEIFEYIEDVSSSTTMSRERELYSLLLSCYFPFISPSLSPLTPSFCPSILLSPFLFLQSMMS